MNPIQKKIAEALKKCCEGTVTGDLIKEELTKDISNILEQADKRARIEWRLAIHVNKKKFKPFNPTEFKKIAGCEE